jgi:hydroxyquinol 1,2-dioxygenase
MSMDTDSSSLTRDVIRSFAGTPDLRLRALLVGLTEHLHALVRDVRPTLAEWEAAIRFLTAVGHASTETRQEFILLSDVLGVSSLVAALNEQPGGTEGTVLGPFHVVASPARELGDSIDLIGGKHPAEVRGSVVGTDGRPLPRATVDVWQCSEEGFYDVQQPDAQPPGNGRGLFRADAGGNFWFRTVVPSHYPIPTDGPVGDLLTATDRHPYRPAHIHLIVAAPGYATLTTHVFIAGSPYLDSDAVFAVKEGLVADFASAPGDSPNVVTPLRVAEVEIVLVPVDSPASTDGRGTYPRGECPRGDLNPLATPANTGPRAT